MTGAAHAPAAFTSADFAEVPAELVPDRPDRLVHADVLGARGEEGGRDDAFSAVRGHLVRTVDLPSRTMSMTIGGLRPGQSTRMHRHNYETIIYVVEGSGRSVIGEREVAWKAGDAFYVPVWAWHRHENDSPTEAALYVACENAPLLQNLGVALREER